MFYIDVARVKTPGGVCGLERDLQDLREQSRDISETERDIGRERQEEEEEPCLLRWPT